MYTYVLLSYTSYIFIRTYIRKEIEKPSNGKHSAVSTITNECSFIHHSLTIQVQICFIYNRRPSVRMTIISLAIRFNNKFKIYILNALIIILYLHCIA